MRDKRNCANNMSYPIYPNMVPPMGYPAYPMGYQNMGISNNTFEQQLNNIEQQLNLLDERVTRLEKMNMGNTSNNTYNKYSDSNYYMV